MSIIGDPFDEANSHKFKDLINYNNDNWDKRTNHERVEISISVILANRKLLISIELISRLVVSFSHLTEALDIALVNCSLTNLLKLCVVNIFLHSSRFHLILSWIARKSLAVNNRVFENLVSRSFRANKNDKEGDDQ